jgi:hypothetical protein
MAKKDDSLSPELLKHAHPSRSDRDYYLIHTEKGVVDELAKAQVFSKTCERPCTKILTLLPKTNVPGHSGVGYQMINIDGYRTINAYVIADPLNSSNQRGFTLELSFSLNPFVYGVGVVGETSFFFNFDNYFEPGTLTHRTARCETGDLTTVGGLPWIGGIDQAHILRSPVMGPYVRASVFNEDGQSRNVEVRAYLST